MKVGQRLVVDAHEVEYGGVDVVDVVDVRFVHHGLEAEFDGLPVAHAAFHSAAGHPHAETIRVLVSAGRTLAFAEWHATQFAAPHDKRGIEQPALLEVGQQCGDGLIHLGTLKAVVFLNTLVSVLGVLEVSSPPE